MRVVASRDWRFLMIQLSQSLNQNLELWFAGLLLASHDASLFAAAQRLALLVAFPLTSIQVVFSPTISRLWAEGDLHRLENVVRTGASFATLAALLVWLPMTVAPAQVLELVFGEPFRDAALVLALLGTAYLINVLSGLCGAALSMSHHEGRAALVTSCAVVAAGRARRGAGAEPWHRRTGGGRGGCRAGAERFPVPLGTHPAGRQHTAHAASQPQAAAHQPGLIHRPFGSLGRVDGGMPQAPLPGINRIVSLCDYLQ